MKKNSLSFPFDTCSQLCESCDRGTHECSNHQECSCTHLSWADIEPNPYYAQERSDLPEHAIARLHSARTKPRQRQRPDLSASVNCNSNSMSQRPYHLSVAALFFELAEEVASLERTTYQD